jgi:hypothetical protein
MSNNELQSVINKFVESVGTAPAQRSAEWYSLRTTTIGGSEVASVLNMNPFKNQRSLIAEKVGIGTAFTGNIATRWGTMFEPLTREWAQQVLLMETPIQETGGIEGVISRQRYSPDGLGVVKLIDEEDNLNDYIVLFEFKAPYRGLPDGKISKHYIPQVQTGLLSIPICELALFINNCYRKCTISDIGFSDKYDTDFHSGDSKKRRTKKQQFAGVLACGIIGFYQTKEQYEESLKLLGYASEEDNDSDYEVDYNIDHNTNAPCNYTSEHDINILMNSRESPLDFGTAKERTLNRLFELCEEKRVTAVYYPMILNSNVINELEFVQTHKKEQTKSVSNPKKMIKIQITQFGEHCDNNEHNIIGYLPWKLLKSDLIIENRREDWQEKIEPSIKETLRIIDDIRNSDNPKEKYNEYYPPATELPNEEKIEVDMADMMPADLSAIMD